MGVHSGRRGHRPDLEPGYDAGNLMVIRGGIEGQYRPAAFRIERSAYIVELASGTTEFSTFEEFRIALSQQVYL